jgi:hypothetical protein
MKLFLEGLTVAIELVGILGLAFVVIRGVPWAIDSIRDRELHPSVHIAGPDDEDIDFTAALRSIGGSR